MNAKEAQQWEDLFMKFRTDKEGCGRLIIDGVPFYCHSHSDAKDETFKREEDEYAAMETLEWHRKKFPDIPVLFVPYCNSWQSWMMFLLPHVCKHYGVSKDTVLMDWTKHFGVGLFYEFKKRMEMLERLKPGEPCDHPGCLAHVSHPCEGCGRIAGGMDGDSNF